MSCIAHEWYNYPNIDYKIPSSDLNTNAIEKYAINDNYVSLVSKESIPKAIHMLKAKPYVKINKDSADSLAGYKVWLKKGTELYLIRGLKNKKDAVMRVYFIDNKYVHKEVRVISLSSGAPDKKLMETPVIVSLPRKPNNVFVYCLGAY